MKELFVLIAVMSVAGSDKEVPGVTVQMTSSDAFMPKTLTIKAGSTSGKMTRRESTP